VENAAAGPENGNVLEHLLGIEAEASALVARAQAEADRRTAESEKRNRLRCEEWYGREAAEMEAAYQNGVRNVREQYEEQLASYRKSLAAITADRNGFKAMVESFLKENKGD
jgi:F0F1-type ATP synthase membrane subunit b/b'